MKDTKIERTYKRLIRTYGRKDVQGHRNHSKIYNLQSFQFKYLKVQKDSTPKRDVLTEEEYIAIRKWMQYKWVNEKGITLDEKLKRRQYGFYFTLHHQMGGRTKEMLGIKWGDISVIPTDKPEDKK